MFSTTALAKNSKFTGQVVGTHQRLDQAARRSLNQILPKSKYFPSSKEIIYFEGSRGPDGLKRKSPGIDEPSHMLAGSNSTSQNPPTPPASSTSQTSQTSQNPPIPPTPQPSSTASSTTTDHSQLDTRTVIEMINDHHWNLTAALQNNDRIRAAFEAAWLAHMITDGLTPAHHFPLSDVKDELMTDKEMVKIFGEPLKGIMHGRNMLETMRNNWLYWGAGGHMSKHIAYEYGVLTITAPLTPHSLEVTLTNENLQELNVEQIFRSALQRIQALHIYDRFLADGWTTEIALETKDVLLPEIIRTITLGWYSACAAAYHLKSDNIQDNHPTPDDLTNTQNNHPQPKCPKHHLKLKEPKNAQK